MNMYSVLGHPDTVLLAEQSAWKSLAFKQRQCNYVENRLKRSSRNLKKLSSTTDMKQEKQFSAGIRKVFSAIKKMAKTTMRSFKGSTAASSDDLYYINLLYIFAQRSKKRGWMKNYVNTAWTSLGPDFDEAISYAFQPFVDALDGDINSEDAANIWDFVFAMMEVFYTTTTIQSGL